MKDFLEKNYKIFVWIFVGLGLFFIGKLWWMGMYVGSAGGGGFLSISIGWVFKYFWISASYIAIIFFIISFFIIKKLKIENNKIKKVYLSLIILFLGLIGKQLFYIISPQYKFYNTSASKLYLDDEKYVNDIDLYLKLIGKYCQDIKYPKIGDCHGKYSSKFRTVEDYIVVLDYAKNNDSYMYYNAYIGLKENTLFSKILFKYPDEYLKIYLLKNTIFSNNLLIELKQFYNKSFLNELWILEKNSIQKLGEFYENKNDSFWNKEYTSKFNQILDNNNINF